MDKKEPRRYIFSILVVVLIVLSLVFILMPQKQSEIWRESAESKKATTTKVESIPLVVFIGDSICGGAADGLKAEQRWPQMLAQRLKWFPYNACVGGSGYINPGQGGNSTYQQVADTLFLKFKPAIIIVEGGQNDVAAVSSAGADMASEISVAACNLYGSMRKALPKAQLFVMTPFYGVDQAPEIVDVMESAINECAAKYKVKVISGTREWLQDKPELFIADQTHPNGKGHLFIADKLVAWFKANHLRV